MTVRLEVRLDEEHRAHIEEIAGVQGVSISDVVRALIDDAYEEMWRQRRLRAAQRIAAITVEDAPDPEELARQLNNKYEPADFNL